MIKLIINGELADLNQYINAISSNRFIGGKLKKENTELVFWECKQQKLSPVKEYPVHITFKWYSKDNRKDIDNVSSMGRKVILDGMVLAKVLENDSRKFISGFTDEFYISKENPRIEIIII